MTAPVTCPNCSRPAKRVQTRYGIRDKCEPCGLWSWDGKPLVSAEVHEARKLFHATFDPLWKDAPSVYDIDEEPGTPERKRAEKRIRRTARVRAYEYLSALSGLPEEECHGATQDDLEKLAWLTKVAASCSGPAEVRVWARRRREAA